MHALQTRLVGLCLTSSATKNPDLCDTQYSNFLQHWDRGVGGGADGDPVISVTDYRLTRKYIKLSQSIHFTILDVECSDDTLLNLENNVILKTTLSIKLE